MKKLIDFKFKKLTRKALIKRLDKIISEMVRERDMFCQMCGSTSQLTAGHVFSRRFYSTRWDLTNIYGQCWKCNFKHGIDPYPYWAWFIQEFGKDKFTKLGEKAHQVSHFKDSDLQEMLVKMLLKFKSLKV